MPRKRTTWKRKRGRPALKRLAPGSSYRFGYGQMGRGTPYYINRDVIREVPVKPDTTWEDRLTKLEKMTARGESTLKNIGSAVRAGTRAANDATSAVLQGSLGLAVASAVLMPGRTVQFAANTASAWASGTAEGLMKSKPISDISDRIKKTTTKGVMKSTLYTVGNVTTTAMDMIKGVVKGTAEYGDEIVAKYQNQQQERAYENQLKLEEAQYADMVKGYMEQQRQYDWIGDAHREAVERSGDPNIKVRAGSYMVQTNPSKQPFFVATSLKSNLRMMKNPDTNQWRVEPEFTYQNLPHTKYRAYERASQIKRHDSYYYIGGSEL